MLPVILGLSGPALTADERDFFRDADPAGFILFGRNIVDRSQLRALTDSLREVSGRSNLPILVDQEGGRVARLAPPEWPHFPAAWRFGELYEKAPISAIEAARVNAQAIGILLFEVGINVGCLPVLDLRRDDTHEAIGDRAMGSEPIAVAALGRAVLQGLEASGVVGIVKHMPGHGLAAVDSHETMPVAEADEAELERHFAPFRSLNDAPVGMVAHLLFPAWDPEKPASLSRAVIDELIRRRIGFQGLLLSDDLAMGALTGTPAERAGAAIAAGCDVALYCSGIQEENEEVAAALAPMDEPARERLERAMARIEGTEPGEVHEKLAAKRDQLLSYA
jgi:beta-N-acetylhexosaminidase